MSPTEQEEVPFEALLLEYVSPEPAGPGLETATGLVALVSANRDYFTSEYMRHAWKSGSIKNKLEEAKNLKAQQKAEKALPSDVHFKHDRLQNDAECFRLLKIMSADPKGLIECSVEEFRFDQRPTFVALSYVWSDKGPVAEFSRDFRTPDNEQLWPFNPYETRTITCNGKPCTVSANLHDALLGLAGSLNGRYLWVDAICINQEAGEEDHEKNVQVQNMHRIYGGADEVFIWLGRKHKTRDIGFSLLESWPPYPEDVNNANIQFRGKTYRTAKEFMNASAATAEFVSWHFLMVAISEGWFQRVWTLQEFILASKYAFFYGGKQIPTASIKNAMSWVYFICQSGPSTMFPAWVNFQPSIFNLKRQWDERQQKFDFTESVFLGATRLATNPRDKVYALMALIEPDSLQPSMNGGAKLPPLNIAYGKTMKDLYLDIALRLLYGKAGLSILSLVNHPLPKATYKPKSKKPIGNRLIDEYRGKSRGWTKENRSVIKPEEDVFLPELQPDWESCVRTDAFPSWVPKLVSSLGSQPFFQRAGPAGQAVFRAASNIPPSFRTAETDGHRVLSVAAKPFDTIKTVVSLPQSLGELHWSKFAEKAQRTELWSLITSLVNKKHGGSSNYAPTGERTVSAIWRTLITDIWNRLHPAPDYVETFFLNWLAKASLQDKVRRSLDLEKEPEHRKEEIFMIVLRDVGMDRKFVVTEKGYFGLAPPTVKVGDAVMLVAGMYVPFTFRKHLAGENSWLLVGETYVHGIIDGEFERETGSFGSIDIL